MRKSQVSLQVKVHVGKTLIEASNTYHSLMETILEGVQNGIDNDGMHIKVLHDQRRHITGVMDDGDGAGVPDVERAFKSVNDTLKEGEFKMAKSGRMRIGRYGRGFFAPLTKCRYFEFISSPKGADEYMSYRFEQANIVEAKELEIKGTHLPKMKYKHFLDEKDKRNENVVDWASGVFLYDCTTDRVVNNVRSADQIIKAVFDQFGRIMNEWDIRLSVTFIAADGTVDERKNLEAPRFMGTPLEKVEYVTGGSLTTFEMYLAQKDDHGKPSGTVLMSDIEDPSNFTFKQLVDSVASYKLLSEEVMEGLLSGYFEGEVVAHKARLHPNRKQYMMTEEVQKVCDAITKWYEEVGRQHVERIKDTHQDKRRQRLARESLQHIEHMLKRPENAHLNDSLRKLKQGTIGREHAEPEPEAVVEKQKVTSVSIAGGFGGLKGALAKKQQLEAEQKQQKPKPKAKPKEALKGHHPLTAVGPAGQKRTVVKDNSLGLQIIHDNLEGRDELWLLDEQQGVLFFNIRHPVWVMCDDDGKTKVSDTRVMRLQEMVAIIALQWLALSEEHRADWRRMTDDTIGALAFLFQESPSFNVGKKL